MFPKLQISPRGKQLLLQMGKYCWRYFWTGRIRLIVHILGENFLEQPVSVTLLCFLWQKQFNQRQLNDLILKRQPSLGSRTRRSRGSYKHPNPPLPWLSPIQCKNELLMFTLISILASIIDEYSCIVFKMDYKTPPRVHMTQCHRI